MKKKGLIVATIVMVLVLAVSLTTATYAWFTATASATISPMNIVTKASEGLQIAAVVNSGGMKYYSGDLALDEISGVKKWAQYNDHVLADESGFGSELNLTTSGSYLIDNMYGASGDGVTMFAQSNAQYEISKDHPIAAAAENVSYLALDFAIIATSAGEAYINQIYVQPSSTKKGMAGSMRIALFATAPGEAAGSLPTWAVATNGKMLYEPYGAYTYSGSTFGSTAEATNYYTAAGTEGTSAGTKTSGASTLQALWTSSKVVYGKQTTAPSGKVLSPAGNGTAYATLTEANADIKNTASTPVGIASLGQVTADQIIYLRLVIWFDGESKACVQEFAGGGATVTINFSLQAAA